MDEDVKDVAKRLIQGSEKRKKRIKQNRQSTFDNMANVAIQDALGASCGNIDSIKARKATQDKIYKSIVENTPYEYIGDVCCGRRQFYEYRNEFIGLVALRLGMVTLNKE